MDTASRSSRTQRSRGTCRRDQEGAPTRRRRRAIRPIWYQDVAMAMNTKLKYKGFGTWYLYTPWALDISSR